MVLVAAVSVPVRGALTTVIDNGPAANRVDVVFVGDGYTQANLDSGAYDQHINSYLEYMFHGESFRNDPFDRYAKFFNVHKIDVVSVQSGADRPYDGVFKSTALDATFDNGPDARLLTISTSKANSVRNQALAGTGVTADIQLVVVNETKYGGSGGSWAVFAGQNTSAHEIALHELAHSFSNLADEYAYTSAHYSGAEPSAPNVTKNPSGEKWSRWIGFDDPRGFNLDIGVFEGAMHHATGLYRPSAESKMRALNRPFDAVSREALILDIYEHVDPLDAWRPNSSPILNEPLWVDIIDAAVQSVEWFVDGVLVESAQGTIFDAITLGYGAGDYLVEARVYDTILDHVGDGSLFDLVRKDLDRLEASVAWKLIIAPPLLGDFDDDGLVANDDLLLWIDGFGAVGDVDYADGDADGDSDVDGADFLVWQANLGRAAGGGIPEPGTGFLCTVLTVALVSERRRRMSGA